MKKKYASFILALIFNLKLNAQWVSNTNLNTIVSDDATYSETVPISSPGLNGTTYVSWFQGNSSGSYDAMLQLLDVSGVPLWSTPLVVSNHPQQSALYNSDFTTDHAGNALMAFQDMRNGSLQTVIYKIDATGNFVWGADGILLHDANATFEAAPRIGVFEFNNVVVSWSASAGSNKWVAYQIIDITGNSLFATPHVIDSPTLNYSRAVPITSGPYFALVYVQEVGSFPGLTSTIFCNYYNYAGTAQWNSPLQVSGYNVSFTQIPLVAVDNNGALYIGFNSGTPSAPAINDAFVQKVTALGNVAFGVNGLELSVLSGNHKFIKDMYINLNNSKLYCLLKITDNAQNGAGVYVQAVSLSGTISYAPNAMAVVPISTALPCEPYNIKDAGIGAYITYTEGTFNNQTLKVNKISYPGTFLYSSPVVLSDAISGKSRVTSAVDTATYQLVVSWEDSRINQGIYAQNINYDGNLGVITKFSESGADDMEMISYTSLINDYFTVKANTNAYLTIFSNTGQIIYSQFINEGIQSIDCSSFSNGLYLFEVKTKTNSLKGKFIQQKL